MYKLAPLTLALAVSTSLHMAVGVRLEKRAAGPLALGEVVLAPASAPAMQWVELLGPVEGIAAAPQEVAFVSPPKRKLRKRKAKRAAAELLPKEAAVFSPEGEGEGEEEASAEEGKPGGAAENGEAASGAAGEAGGAPPGGQVGGSSVEDGALQRHLQASARGCYPLRARRQRLRGMVRLAFCVDAQGMAAQARLAQSSGHSSLDEAALECVVKKAQPLPESSRGGCFVAPILFGVQ